MQISNQPQSSHTFHMKRELKIKSIHATAISSKLFAPFAPPKKFLSVLSKESSIYYVF